MPKCKPLTLKLTSATAIAALLAVLAVGLTARAQTQPQPAQPGKASPRGPANFDVRVSPGARAAALQRLGIQPPTGDARRDQARQALARLREDLPAAEATFSPLTGGAEMVRNPKGMLTPPAPGADGLAIVNGFLQSNAELYGLSSADLATLRFKGESLSRGSGMRMVRMEQVVNGIPVFESDTRFSINRQGQLIRSVGLLMPGAANAAAAAPTISSAEALRSAMQSVGITVDANAVTATAADGKERLLGGSDQIAGEVSSSLVYFPLAPGVLVVAFQQITFTTGASDFLTVVDASTGTLLWRKNIRAYQSNHDARFRVYVQGDGTTPADSPAPHSPTLVAPASGTQIAEIAPSIVSMHTAMDATASPNGWINDCPGGVCGPDESQTIGNNVVACMDATGGGGPGGDNQCDTDATHMLDGNGRPTGNLDPNSRPRDFFGLAPNDFQTGFVPPPQGGAGNAEVGQNASDLTPAGVSFRRGVTAQLFYTSNWYHDQLFNLGFDEAAGNFQQTNFSGSGTGNDRVLADVQDNGDTDNANFSTPPDGDSGRMQMYRFTGPTIDRDSSLDAEIVIHELTHGLSNRLIGNAAGLLWDVGGSMGEGWSDFYALSLLNNTNVDLATSRYASGGYATYKIIPAHLDNYLYGIRRFPYSIDNTVNPLTWADVDDVTNSIADGIMPSPIDFNGNGGLEVHNAGEVWALSLWEVRARIIADPAGANGNVPIGNLTMLQLVTDALKLTPNNPTFIEARDALIDADCANNACANERWIWEGFADRGLGHGASAPFNVLFGYVGAHESIRESFLTPNLDIANPTADVTVDDLFGNRNGSIDPGESIRVSVKLTNPWRAAGMTATGATATLTSSTLGVSIVDGASSYGTIAPLGTSTGDTFLITVGPGVPCGAAIDFTLNVTSGLGARSVTFRRRVGFPTGTGTPVTYSSEAALGVAIPDDAPRGITHSIVVADDFEIADVNLRINSITHPFVGDLTAMLRSPNSIGVDLVALIGGLSADQGDGDNLTDMVIDDDLPPVVANDMVQQPLTSQPFTGDWLPTFNAPWTQLAFDSPPDPIGNLDRFNGLSTAGTWTLHVSDQLPPDVGTLNQWSMDVTPVAFSCAAFVPSARVEGTKTVAGNFAPGGAIAYTITLANNGALNQLDNPGDEFTDGLPATLTLVSAVATTGMVTATPASNIVTWNGALAALGGSVTITINATVNANVGGLSISNQGGIVYDADANGSNESGSTTDNPATAGPLDPTVFQATCPAITITPATFGPIAAGAAVNQAFVASGGVSPYTYALTGTLPTGLTLSAAGVLSGTTTQSGSFPVTITATDTNGCTGALALTLVVNELTYYLAEGATGPFFDLDILIANPSNVAAPVTVTFLKDDATTVVQNLTVNPLSRLTIEVDDIPGLEATAVSTVVKSNNGVPLAVERTMFWDSMSYGSHTGSAVDGPQTQWLFAEGSQGFFDTYVLLANASTTPANVKVTFLREFGGPVVRDVTVLPTSRLNVFAGDIPELEDRSFSIVVDSNIPIIAERAMYFGTRLFEGGHESAGVSAPAANWFFAEGATGSYFDTYVLVGNPNSTTANVTFTFLTDTGLTVTRVFPIAGNSRLTVNVEEQDAALASAAVSTTVSSDQPVIAERAMYWAGTALNWFEAHNSFGATGTGLKWGLAEGRVGTDRSFETYLLLANANTTQAASVQITFLRTTGAPVVKTYTVNPTTRLNVYVNGEVPELLNESFGAIIEVTNGVGISVERALYSNSDGIVWAAGTNATAVRLP